MQLKRGYICYFHYQNYHKDPYPLALVLYVDKEIMHCLNIHYLSNSLTDELIETIVDVALRKLKAKDAYKFYHNHLKKQLPHVIQKSYRVYKTKYVKNASIVSYGFETSKGFLATLKAISNKPSNQAARDAIKTEIDVVKEIKKTPEELIKVLPLHQIVDEVDDYFKKIKSIIKPKIDTKKYTSV